MGIIVISATPASIAVQIAAIMGIPVYGLPANFSLEAIAAGRMQPQNSQTQGSQTQGSQSPIASAIWINAWIKEPPSIDRYRAAYDAFLSVNIQLLNRPEHYARMQQFSDIYSKLPDLAPDPALVHSWAEVRQSSNLRHSRTDPQSEPLGRSFRVYLYNRTILTYAYSWETDDPLKWLTVEEEEAIFAVALAAAARLELPFVAIDIGQQGNGRWVVVEVGDAQFSLLDQTPLIVFFGELEKLVPDG